MVSKKRSRPMSNGEPGPGVRTAIQVDGGDDARSGVGGMAAEEEEGTIHSSFLQAVLKVLMGVNAPLEEESGIEQETSRAGNWASGWLRAHDMHLKRAGALERTGGYIARRER